MMGGERACELPEAVVLTERLVVIGLVARVK